MLTADSSRLTAEIAQRFADLHPPFDSRQATVEAHRCLNCFDAPCMGACPTHIDVPGFIKKIASGNVVGSAKKILEANVLGASCSRVCPVEVLCEGSCVMHQRNEKPIEIGRLQRFATETYYNAGGTIPLRSRPERTERIACIGGGPASLACAAELRQHGFQVAVFDNRTLPGGLNTYGVAEYKLRTEDSLREVELVRKLGVDIIHRNIDLPTLTELDTQYDAIFLGVGLGEMHRLQVAATAASAAPQSVLIDALEFIAAYKSGSPLPVGPRVVVIGAGNTAIDAACAAKRLGAEQVTVVYRRRAQHISAFSFEYEHALKEGVGFVWESVPIALRTNASGAELVCTRLAAEPDGRIAPLPGSEFTIPCDLVIPAIGQSPLLSLLEQLRGVELGIQSDKGRIVINRRTGQTGNPRYFAGGDCVNGGREVVDAVADGKRAAQGIAAHLAQPQTHTSAEARIG